MLTEYIVLVSFDFIAQAVRNPKIVKIFVNLTVSKIFTFSLHR